MGRSIRPSMRARYVDHRFFGGRHAANLTFLTYPTARPPITLNVTLSGSQFMWTKSGKAIQFKDVTIRNTAEEVV